MPRMNKRCLLAIDPGKTGGIAWLLEDGLASHVKAVKMPDSEQGIFDVLSEIESTALRKAAGSIHAIIERVSFRPKQRGGWEFSGNYHGCRMALIALIIHFINPTPRQWQESMRLVVKLPKKKSQMSRQELQAHYHAKKQLSKAKAMELYPDLRVTHMISEALLLLEYFRRRKQKAR